MSEMEKEIDRLYELQLEEEKLTWTGWSKKSDWPVRPDPMSSKLFNKMMHYVWTHDPWADAMIKESGHHGVDNALSSLKFKEWVTHGHIKRDKFLTRGIPIASDKDARAHAFPSQSFMNDVERIQRRMMR